jgi:LuxR family maltose regulon positive regulatory protein
MTRLGLARVHLSLRDAPAASAQLAALRQVIAERPLLGLEAERAAELERQVRELPGPRAEQRAALTAAELRLLPLLATHLSFREIADRLFVSRNTVKTQAISVYRKLGASSRSEAIARATELDLVEETTGATRAG